MLLSCNRILGFTLLLLASCSASGAPSDLVARILTLEGKTQVVGEPGDVKTPLGSMYKLFVFSFLSEISAPEVPYTCGGRDPEEIFCCSPGDKIDLEAALAKSCTPYFNQQRLGYSDLAWRNFWLERSSTAPAWLLDARKVKPETVVPVDEVLKVLSAIRSKFLTFRRIEAATVGSVVFGTASSALKTWGTTLRVKTFTWREAKTQTRIDERGFTGGFAGWIADGSAIWVSSPGYGRGAFKDELKPIIDSHMPILDSGCVLVKFFDRYPIASISPDGDRPQGKVHVKFKNGNELSFIGDGTLTVQRKVEGIFVTAHLSTNGYIARVIDREVNSTPLEAGRAFAVAIRTFLTQNAKDNEGCKEIADSSHTQRVSPSVPSSEALTIARWSDGLVLDRVSNVRYHSTKEGPNRMSWPQAKSLALSGFSMAEILKAAYPTWVLTFGAVRSTTCILDPTLSKWIDKQSQRWRSRLYQESGFELPDRLKVCQAPVNQRGSKVFADLDSQEIYVPPIHNSDDEISILHEYLHIGFRNHPRGRDEAFIEKMARLLQEKI